MATLNEIVEAGYMTTEQKIKSLRSKKSACTSRIKDSQHWLNVYTAPDYKQADEYSFSAVDGVAYCIASIQREKITIAHINGLIADLQTGAGK